MNNKEALIFLVFDLGLLLLVSAAIAGATALLGAPFLPIFLFSFSVICVIGWLSNMVIQNRTQKIIKKLENSTARMIASQTLTANCAYCRVPNSVLFNAAEEMTFTCTGCKQLNKIILQYGAARTTTPLDVKLPTEEVFSDSSIDKENGE